MFVITVTFDIDPQHSAVFETAMIDQARNSLDREEECLFFEVCRAPGGESRWFLYEIYTTEAAFHEHLASPHFKTFDALVGPWVLDKQVQSWRRSNGVPLTL